MPSDTANSFTSATAALATLTLPTPARLKPAQVRGAACVWCGTVLHGEDAVDLGQRYGSVMGVYGRWFPRGCRACTLAPAQDLYATHKGSCEQCTAEPVLCETRRTLRALVEGLLS